MDAGMWNLAKLHDICLDAFVSSGASHDNATVMAQSIVAAEADGLRNVGLGYLPLYCEQLKSGKINGKAVPAVTIGAPGIVNVDAGEGFAHPAIERGMADLEECVRKNGIAAMGVSKSSSAGIIGHLLEPLARKGFLLMGFANVCPLMAPWGGNKPLFGTNPLAAAFPSNHREPVVIDFATSATAMVNILTRAEQGQPLEPGWGIDKQGNQTLDGKAVLDGGALLPFGAHKGYMLALLVEVLAAGLTGANWSKDAPSFMDEQGAPQRIGQFFIALDPARFGNGDFLERVEELFRAIADQEGAMLPGDDRWQRRSDASRDGVQVDEETRKAVLAYCRKSD